MIECKDTKITVKNKPVEVNGTEITITKMCDKERIIECDKK